MTEIAEYHVNIHRIEVLVKLGIDRKVAEDYSPAQAKMMVKKLSNERLRKKMVDVKPYVIQYLVKLGVTEDHAKTFSFLRAYDVLYRRLSKLIGKRKCKDIHLLYWLWTHGVAIDALGQYTEQEAKKMLEMIWTQNKSRVTK